MPFKSEEERREYHRQYMAKQRAVLPDRLAWLDEQLAGLPKREAELRKQAVIEAVVEVKKIPAGVRALPPFGGGWKKRPLDDEIPKKFIPRRLKKR